MLVITTPTGQIGRQILDKVMDSAEPIRVIARDPPVYPPGCGNARKSWKARMTTSMC